VLDTPIVAIVDDDDAIREALDDLVRSCGYETQLYKSGIDFLAYGRRDCISCILLDVNMPGLNGLEVQERMNAQPPKPPVIFFTSHADETLRKSAFLGGASAYLTKPADASSVIDCIEAATRACEFQHVAEL
jgi:FixJ family two-component response regulator